MSEQGRVQFRSNTPAMGGAEREFSSRIYSFTTNPVTVLVSHTPSAIEPGNTEEKHDLKFLSRASVQRVSMIGKCCLKHCNLLQ